MIHVHAADGALGHAGFNRFKRILDDGDASTAFDREKSRRPIVKCTSQNNSDDALTVSAGGAAKKGIYRRSMAIFPRPTRKRNLAIVEQEVAIGRSHVNAATFDLVSFPGLDDRNRPAAVKNAAEGAGCSDMDYHKERSRQISGKCAKKRAKRLHAPGGSSDNDDIARHQKTPPFA